MRPEWLWALLPAAVLAALLWRLRKRSGSWSSVIAPELLPYLVGEGSGQRQRNLVPALLLAWSMAALAAAGPSFNKIPQPVHQKQDALILVLDLSLSMIAGDLAPSRIDRARQKLQDLLERRKEGQTGLVAYAGDAHIVTPLTDDTPTIANLLPALHPNIMPIPGSQPAAAIAQALELLHSAGIRQGRILLVTDGVSDRDRQGVTAALKGSGMAFSVMGIGTATGAPLPLPRGGFLKDDSGAIVMPTLDENALRALAAANNGRYMRMQIDDSDLDYLLAETSLNLPEQTLALDRSADTWEDQGYLLVLLLLPAALALFRRGWIVCLLPLLALPLPQPAQAGLWDDLWLTRDQQGQRALQQEDNEAAAQLFESDAWAGTAAYRAGDYETAEQRFADGDSADAWYNRGNALARAGQLDEAIAAYRESLQREPGRSDAEENLQLIEQLKQQQQQQDQQGDQGEDQQNQEQQDGQEGSENQDSTESGEQQDSPSEPGQQNQRGTEPPQNTGEETGTEREQNPEQAEREDQDEQQAQQSAELEPGDEQVPTGETLNAQAQQADAEKDQAMEQWLRRVPDDPSGLLRQKFLYQSQQRLQEGKTRDDETDW
ncbi:VWA domain-containing protein [Pseudohalioglobus lutimaris]|uniref:VWA domain-containing protein n=1 Tax=Pseudohalioglobus lutimaris TaxID=1737061 RepID=A0A2N5WY69_9GAMM|nr:VWA domain-containing protein [Pseudohalioglobus lutimaris]